MKLPSSLKIRPVKAAHSNAVPHINTDTEELEFTIDGNRYTVEQFVEHYRPADARARAFCELMEIEFPTRGTNGGSDE